MLIVLSGLPGVGKTTIARALARRIGGIHLRIDSIESAIRESGSLSGPLDDSRYRVGYAVAEDNLRLGQIVIADSVNPIQLTRDAWLHAARQASARATEVEIKCSDAHQHRHRVESRRADLPGLKLPTWDEVLAREYAAWNREHLILDTAVHSVEQNVQTIIDALPAPPVSRF